jgi:hypothetical protein
MFLIKQKKFSTTSNFQISRLDNESKNLFNKYSHIYLISEDNRQVQSITFPDICSSCCILVPHSLETIPKGYFFDNPRFSKNRGWTCSPNNQIPLQGFSLNLTSLHFYAEIKELEDECCLGCQS